MIKDKTLSLDAQLAAVQAHIEDLEVRVYQGFRQA